MPGFDMPNAHGFRIVGADTGVWWSGNVLPEFVHFDYSLTVKRNDQSGDHYFKVQDDEVTEYTLCQKGETSEEQCEKLEAAAAPVQIQQLFQDVVNYSHNMFGPVIYNIRSKITSENITSVEEASDNTIGNHLVFNLTDGSKIRTMRAFNKSGKYLGYESNDCNRYHDACSFEIYGHETSAINFWGLMNSLPEEDLFESLYEKAQTVWHSSLLNKTAEN